jgi:NAD(P)-dependent dehydrogenase (short-subunit alcohol dehydrogenase family)
LASELWELGATAEYIPADISIKDDVQALVDGTVKTFGKLDVTGTNASFTGSTSQLATQTLEAYNAIFDTSVRGLLFCLKHELRVMTEQGSGSIVNLSSTFGERGGAGAALYTASKHAVKDPRGSVRKTEGDGARFSDREGAISGRRR